MPIKRYDVHLDEAPNIAAASYLGIETTHVLIY